MNCIKCGVEIPENQVFCDNCLAGMEKYPVKPNITVNIPIRPASPPAKKKSRRLKYIKPEDSIRHLKTKVRILWLALLLVFAAFLIVAVMLMNLLDHQQLPIGTQPGQNYGTMDTPTTQTDPIESSDSTESTDLTEPEASTEPETTTEPTEEN